MFIESTSSGITFFLLSIIGGTKMEKEEKYTVGDLMGLPEKARLVKIGLIIANELHSIYGALWELKENRLFIKH